MELQSEINYPMQNSLNIQMKIVIFHISVVDIPGLIPGPSGLHNNSQDANFGELSNMIILQKVVLTVVDTVCKIRRVDNILGSYHYVCILFPQVYWAAIILVSKKPRYWVMCILLCLKWNLEMNFENSFHMIF